VGAAVIAVVLFLRAGSPGSWRAAVAEALLETEGLTRRFGALAAVDGVSLRIERGTVHAIIGRTAPASPRS